MNELAVKNELSVKDEKFLATLRVWLENGREILVLFQFSRLAGNKSFEFFSSFDALSERLQKSSKETKVTAFRQPQLPTRGVVDDAFIDNCLQTIPDGPSTWLLKQFNVPPDLIPGFNESAGETHADLRESLEDSRGSPVAVGPYPPFWIEDPSVLAGIMPDEHGKVKRGCY